MDMFIWMKSVEPAYLLTCDRHENQLACSKATTVTLPRLSAIGDFPFSRQGGASSQTLVASVAVVANRTARRM